jgi:hypothetical protein
LRRQEYFLCEKKRPDTHPTWVFGLNATAEIAGALLLVCSGPFSQQLQQTGMLFMLTQQTQPALVMAVIQSQLAWIIAQQAGSPLVQVMQTPSFVASHLHMPIAMLQQHIIIPFIIAQQLHMPPAIIEQRFCSIVADIASSQVHVIFIPPVHFSILILHRGTIIHCGADGMPPVAPIGPVAAWPIPGIPMPARSITIALVILLSSKVLDDS